MNILTPEEHNKVSSFLVNKYAALKDKNQSYSLRAFSQKIGISSGALSEILANKRMMSSKTAIKILKNLHFSDIDIEEFFTKKSSREFSNLSLEQYKVMSDWRYFALLNLIELPHEEHTTENLAQRLNLEEKDVRSLIEKLLNLEMIEINGKRLTRTKTRYQTDEDIASSAIKKYHQSTFELSEKALKEVDIALRDFCSITFKLNPKNIEKIKKSVRKFQDDICEQVETDDPTEIYHFNIGLYPLTTPKIKGN